MINDTCQTPLIIFCLSPPYILRDFVVVFSLYFTVIFLLLQQLYSDDSLKKNL
jgi:hypothetical protein